MSDERHLDIKNLRSDAAHAEMDEIRRHECPQCGQRVIDGTTQDGCRDPDCPEAEEVS